MPRPCGLGVRRDILARMADTLILTLTTGDKVSLEVGDGKEALHTLIYGHGLFDREWI
jgi:hypothetical protein